MRKLSDIAIENIADSIVDLILSRGKSLHVPKVGGGNNESNIIKSKRSRLIKPLEHDFRKGIIPLFEQQKDKVIGTLQGRKAANYNINGAIRVPTTQEEIKSFTEYVLPKITAMMAIAGKSALSELEIGIAFDIMNPKVIEWLQVHAAEAVKEIGVTTKHLLKQTLIEGMENGESIAKLTERIRQAYLPLDIEGYRAKRIAMTETKNAVSQGNLQGYRQSGLTGKKGTLLGPNPCEFCISLHDMGLIDLDDTWEGYESPAFHPNCYSKDTEIYTKNGWQYIKDVEIDELVLTLIPENKQLEWNKIKNKVTYKQDKMIHLSNKQKSFDMLVSENHPYFGYKVIDRGKRGRILEPIWYKNIDEISPHFTFYTSSEWNGEQKDTININGTILNIEDYCKLMGYYLSEGSVVKRGEKWYQISITQSKEKNNNKYLKIYEDLKKLNINLWLCKGGIYFSDVNIGEYLIKFGKSFEKYIPEEIKELPAKYIKIFLDAYLLGDGSLKKAKKWKDENFEDARSYSTSSKRIADDLGELIIKIGKSVGYRFCPSKGKKVKFRNGDYVINHNTWIINELTSRYKNFCNIISQRVDYNNYVYDVEVDNHTILTRRNGRVVWGSNCHCDIYFRPD